MSGVIMARYSDGIELLTDGMLSGDTDPTLTGILSKPIVFTHMPAVIAMTGDYVTLNIGLMFSGFEWVDFDDMIENFRQAVGEQIEWALRNRPGLYEMGARYFLGGYSPKRDRWETYKMEVYAKYEDPWEGIGELLPSPQLEMAPAPDVAALQRYGFDATMVDNTLNLNLGDLTSDVLIRLMRAQRATEIGFGLRGEDVWTPGHMVGFFIEHTSVSHLGTLRRVVWRFPDEIGKPIDAATEGWPVVNGKAMIDEPANDDQRDDGRTEVSTVEPRPAPEAS